MTIHANFCRAPLGTSIDRAGDVDGDGVGDVVVGAPGVDLPIANGTDAGVVYAVSGATSLPIQIVEPTLPSNQGLGFGQFVSWIGDMDGDGRDDIFGSGPNVDVDYPYGFYGIYSGADGSVIRTQGGYDDAHGFAVHAGNGIGSPGDVNGDGVPEYVEGQSVWLSYYWDLVEGHTITVRDGVSHLPIAHYGFATSLNAAIEAPMDYLQAPTILGDVDGDGISDMAYLSPDQEVVRVVSTASSLVIGIFPAPAPGLGFGATIQGIDDVTGDGLRDVAIGVPGFDGPAGADSGQIIIYPGTTCIDPSNYCFPQVNSSGTWSLMGYSGSTSVTNNDLVLQASGLPPNKVGLFFYGPDQVYLPVGDGRLCAGDGGLGLFRVKPVVVSDSFGFVSKAFDLTVPPASAGDGQIVPGSTWNFQFWFRDPAGGPSGFNFSGGLQVRFCQ